MPSTNPITLIYLADVEHQARLLEQEHRRLEKEAGVLSQKPHAPLLFALSRGLTSLGTRLQEQPPRKPRRA